MEISQNHANLGIKHLPTDQDFSGSGLLTFMIRYFFIVGAYPVHYRMFTTIPSLYLLDASSNTPLSSGNQKVSRYCQVSLCVCVGGGGVQNHPI